MRADRPALRSRRVAIISFHANAWAAAQVCQALAVPLCTMLLYGSDSRMEARFPHIGVVKVVRADVGLFLPSQVPEGWRESNLTGWHWRAPRILFAATAAIAQGCGVSRAPVEAVLSDMQQPALVLRS